MHNALLYSHCRGTEEPHAAPEPQVADPCVDPNLLDVLYVFVSPVAAVSITFIWKPISATGMKKKKILSHNYDLASHNYDLVSHYCEIVYHNYDLASHFSDLASHYYDLVSHYYDLVSHYYEIVSHNYDLVSHYYEILSEI